MADSSITLVGNLTREPELRFTNKGTPQAVFGIAVSRRYQVNGEWQEQTSFFNVVAWRELAENASASLTKGSRVIVAGRLEQRSYEDKQGEKRSVVEVIADDIGPSLRFATAQVEKIDRRGDTGGSRPSGPRDPGPAGDYDEEPF